MPDLLYLAYLEAGFDGDDAATMAAEDRERWALAEFIAQQPPRNAPEPNPLPHPDDDPLAHVTG